MNNILRRIIPKVGITILCSLIYRFQMHSFDENYSIIKFDTNCPNHIIQYLTNLTTVQMNSSEQCQNQIQITNKIGDNKKFNCSEQSSDIKLLINNFLNPPKTYNSQQLHELFQQLQSDEFITLIYLPLRQQQQQIILSQYDSFKKSQIPNIQQIRQQFKQLKYNSCSNKNLYAIISDKQLAQKLKMNILKSNLLYMYKKTPLHLQANCIMQGIRYTLTKISMKKISQEKQIINKIILKGINNINTQNQLYNLIRQVQIGLKGYKILLVKFNEHRPEFHKTADQILSRVGNVLNDKILIVKVHSDNMLRLLNISADPYGTVRLIDVHTTQKCIHIDGKNRVRQFYSRSKLVNAFKYENIYNWIMRQWQQYYENEEQDKKLSQLLPGDYQQENKLIVVLYQRQGCQGCKYTGKILLQIQHIIEQMNSTSKQFHHQLIYKYQMEYPKFLLPLKIVTYNVLNEDPLRPLPKVTPKLQFCYKGICQDLQIGEILKNISATIIQKPKETYSKALITLLHRIQQTAYKVALQQTQ